MSESEDSCDESDSEFAEFACEIDGNSIGTFRLPIPEWLEGKDPATAVRKLFKPPHKENSDEYVVLVWMEWNGDGLEVLNWLTETPLEAIEAKRFCEAAKSAYVDPLARFNKKTRPPKLAKKFPAPAKPKQTGSKREWQAVEKELGTKLPNDYWQYASKYGSGQWIQKVVDATSIYNPLTPGYVRFINEQLQMFRDYRAGNDPSDFEHQVFPESPGVLPIGSNDNGFSIFYLTEGEPDDWPIVVQGHDTSEFHRYDLPLAEFLAQLFHNQTEMPPWPEDWFGQGKMRFKPEKSPFGEAEKKPPAKSKATKKEASKSPAKKSATKKKAKRKPPRRRSTRWPRNGQNP